MLPEINTVITISTSHLSENDRDFLESAAIDVRAHGIVMDTGYGYLVKPRLFLLQFSSSLEYLSVALVKLLKELEASNIYMIEFDCDGVELESYETFEW